ncbi:MurR/RpiR family transcriptional regulator [Clostridium sp. DJ247]|uniref:MurR/RpiR family transcriptional regulator n=1 Tax=Clostridium sp. DJ247 TaxID=2726188 RepID=UPI001624B6CE|nr:MurR/RpiR family transcriptional regulator [Clostridium sp. DJ247]MBC2579493.1 MurR/RpiR family transcriptional regulator [Clostridium sp. DJ247]
MKIDELINRYYDKLNENEKHICKFIMNNKNSCYKFSIEEFARKCNVSTTTLFRFAKKISLQGFSELKAILRLEAEDIKNEDTNFLLNVTDSYHKMIEVIKKRNCKSIFDKIYNSKRIIVYGSGYAQARVASEFKRIFLPTQKIIYHIHGYDMVDSINNLVKSDDFFIIISLLGESEDVIKLAEKLRVSGIPTLSITRMKNNTLASLCDENLYINSIQLQVDCINYELSTPYFILIELLFLKYQEYLNNL